MKIGLIILVALSLAHGESPCHNLLPRIPSSIIPETYDLFLHPRLQEGSFSGTVRIIFNLTEPIACIPVHIKNLIVTYTDLQGADGTSVPIANLKHEPDLSYWVVEGRQKIPPAVYNLTMKFSGSGLNKMTGFYRSDYRLPGESRSRYLMTTKFEPTDAREAFPCFDEPMLKAKFKISIVRPEGESFTALSNSKQLSEESGPSPGEMTVQFEETPKMSTYLVAAIVSDFKALPAAMARNGDQELPLRVFSTPHLLNNTAFALRVGKEILNFFSDYFDIPVPLPKMDMIAIPDFISGAMENWGLITYRENRLLVSETQPSFTLLRRTAHVVGHELSHQWFGNLVTMKWWDDLWLNEGFARFMEYKGVDSLTNSSGISQKRLQESADLSDLKMSVMAKDALLSSHPIVMKVENPAQISEIFDSISYAKGASILTMIEQAMGESTFQKGVRNYLKKHMYGNAGSQDLWTALGEAANMSLIESMDTWLTQTGLPMLNVRRTQNGFKLTQRRFFADSDLEGSGEKTKWDVPICYRTSKAETKRVWLYKKMKSVVIPGDSWVKINCNGTAYYRVNYDRESWADLTDLLISDISALDKKDRANLIDDAFALANAGYLDFDVPLRLTKYLTRERSRLPLHAGFSQLLSIKNRLKKPDSGFSLYVKKLITKTYNAMLGHVMWDFTKPQLDTEQQVYMLQAACRCGVKACRQPVGRFFQRWVRNETSITPDMRSLVYSGGMKFVGTEQDWERVKHRYRIESDPQEKDLLMAALVSTREKNLLQKLLDEALHGNLVRPQDFFSVLCKIGSASPKIAWKWYRKNYKALVAKFTISHKGLGRALEAILGKARNKKQIKELTAFIEKYPQGGAATMAREKTFEKIESNINWLRRAESIEEYFNLNVKQGKNSGKKTSKKIGRKSRRKNRKKSRRGRRKGKGRRRHRYRKKKHTKRLGRKTDQNLQTHISRTGNRVTAIAIAPTDENNNKRQGKRFQKHLKNRSKKAQRAVSVALPVGTRSEKRKPGKIRK